MPDEKFPATLVAQVQINGAYARFDQVLAQCFPAYSRTRLQQWLEAGRVFVNGKPANRKTKVWGAEAVQLLPEDPLPMLSPREDVRFPIVAEDDFLLIINKPAGLVVHPAPGNWEGTLMHGLLAYAPRLASLPRAGIVHRLDKATTGVMVVAKTLTAQTELVRQLQARVVKRQYFALVWGTTAQEGQIDLPIGRHPKNRLKMAAFQQETSTTKPALTYYRRVHTGKLGARVVSLLHCHLKTGRTHQIRVHLQALGHALVGDPLYGQPWEGFSRQALHAYCLGFAHPDNARPCEWFAALPEDFSSLLARAGITPEEVF